MWRPLLALLTKRVAYVSSDMAKETCHLISVFSTVTWGHLWVPHVTTHKVTCGNDDVTTWISDYSSYRKNTQDIGAVRLRYAGTLPRCDKGLR